MNQILIFCPERDMQKGGLPKQPALLKSWT
jgi:hypothetical protein